MAGRDFKRAADVLLLELVNESNAGLGLPQDVITFGTPVNNTNSEKNRETEIKLTAVDGKGYIGEKTVYYNKKDLSSLFGGPTSSFENDGNYVYGASLHSLLTTLSARPDFPALLGEVDVEETTLMAGGDGEDLELTLATTAGGLVYKGTHTITITQPGPTENYC